MVGPLLNAYAYLRPLGIRPHCIASAASTSSCSRTRTSVTPDAPEPRRFFAIAAPCSDHHRSLLSVGSAAVGLIVRSGVVAVARIAAQRPDALRANREPETEMTHPPLIRGSPQQNSHLFLPFSWCLGPEFAQFSCPRIATADSSSRPLRATLAVTGDRGRTAVQT